jgi:hypothetical protein
MVTAENPWSTLRSEHPGVELRFGHLPEGVDATWSEGRIVLSARLGRVARRCALMHELVHVERRVGWPDASAATMESEERIVRREAAARLVPPALLSSWVAERSEIEPITARSVAEEFDVTEEVADEALWVLLRRG